MSRCLTDEELQAMVDREGPVVHASHLEGCRRCTERLDARAQLIARAVDAARAIDVPADARTAMQARLARAGSGGATTLRPVQRTRPWAWAIPLVAAAAIALFFYVIPGVDRRTTVSAAEILDRSRSALAAPISGIEVLTYDLELAGVLADLVPEEQSGRFSVQELVDHDHDGRYRIVKLTSGGQIVGGAADDPLRGTRVRYMRASGRGYLLRFEGAQPAALSIPAMKRTALQTFIGFMQASSTQTIRDVPCGTDACYQIDIPGGAMAGGALVALDSARAVVTVADSRLLEFSAAGRIADRPFMIEFALRSQEHRPGNSAQDADFDIAPQAGDVILQGDASNNPIWDVVTRALRAIPPDAAGDSTRSAPAEHSRR
ncbi:MAG: hypothetical protein ACJ731_12145 [Vicinamibacterales bacterium]